MKNSRVKIIISARQLWDDQTNEREPPHQDNQDSRAEIITVVQFLETTKRVLEKSIFPLQRTVSKSSLQLELKQ